MFITTSRKSNLLSKRFTKYVSVFLPDIKYVPRGKTSLLKIFENARYLGHKYFLKTSYKDSNIIFSIYVFKENSYFLERKYIIDILDLKSLKSLKYIFSINEKVYDERKVFYFLSKKNISKKKDYGLFYNENEDVFEFLENLEYLGFRFRIKNVESFD